MECVESDAGMLHRQVVATERDALPADAIRLDRTARKRYARAIAGQETLRSLLLAQCPGGTW
jgi:hypothetical protein